MANSKKRAAAPAADAASKKTKADLFQGVNIQSIMNAEGPVVKCVLLKADGAIEEVTVDMTPQKQQVKALLGGACHFLGQYEDIEVFLMCNPDAQEDESVPVTKQKMQPPFHGRLGEIRGDILIFRTDASGEQQDFTVDEYTKFQALDLPEWEPEEDDEDDDESEADEDDEAYKKAALAYLIEEFTEENGREPTEDERNDIEAKVEAEMANSTDHPDPSEAALQFFVAGFVEENDREPTEEELNELKQRVAEEMDKLVVSEGEDDDFGDVEDINELIKALMDEAIVRFTKEHGNEPDELTKQAILKNVTRIALTLQGDNQDVEDDDDEEDEEGDDDDDDEEAGDDDDDDDDDEVEGKKA